MFSILLRRMQISPVAVKRHYWTQGDGPNYSKNMLMVGIGTVICAAVGVVSVLIYTVLFDVKKCLYPMECHCKFWELEVSDWLGAEVVSNWTSLQINSSYFLKGCMTNEIYFYWQLQFSHMFEIVYEAVLLLTWLSWLYRPFHIRIPFLESPEKLLHLKSHNKMSNLLITKLFYSHVLELYEQRFPLYKVFQAYAPLSF